MVVECGSKPQVVVLSVAEYKRLRAARPEPEDGWDLAVQP